MQLSLECRFLQDHAQFRGVILGLDDGAVTTSVRASRCCLRRVACSVRHSTVHPPPQPHSEQHSRSTLHWSSPPIIAVLIIPIACCIASPASCSLVSLNRLHSTASPHDRIQQLNRTHRCSASSACTRFILRTARRVCKLCSLIWRWSLTLYIDYLVTPRVSTRAGV